MLRAVQLIVIFEPECASLHYARPKKKLRLYYTEIHTYTIRMST